MERGSIYKWLLFGLAIFLFFTFGKKALFGSGVEEDQPIAVTDWTAPPEGSRAPEETCELDGNRFKATLSSRGGSLRKFELEDPRYHVTDGAQQIDMVST